LHLIDEIRAHGIDDPDWTSGDGTVLMLRYRHRRSKDIDIFVPDPQYLGYVSPRLSEVAEAISADHVEGAGFVKLIRPEGEINFVASPNLTATPFETWSLQRRSVRVETAAEIVAKKLWHRGDQVSARDLFDLSLVIEREPESLRIAGRFLVRHREAFIDASALFLDRRRAPPARWPPMQPTRAGLPCRPFLNVAQQRVERGAVEQAAVGHHGVNAADSADVFERTSNRLPGPCRDRSPTPSATASPPRRPRRDASQRRRSARHPSFAACGRCGPSSPRRASS